eukprot:TRINITY_DN51218_c0_g1_i1.p1 TRINITY_DN51218_c0_g1~~TRINITY_DN51218_c0_g1_i1.p1  ORF type:complete len:175 (+),score=56.26 TRINITY_DN51218_c0_g1_i1:61-585(+)
MMRRAATYARATAFQGARLASTSSAPTLNDVRHMAFKHEYDVPVRWGDMDSYGHVNNCTYVQYLESSRVKLVEDVYAALGHEGMPPPGECSVIVGEIGIKYVAPVTYPDTVTCHQCVSHLDDTSVYICTKGVTSAGKTCFVATCKVVFLNYIKNERAIIPDDVRQELLKYATDQ